MQFERHSCNASFYESRVLCNDIKLLKYLTWCYYAGEWNVAIYVNVYRQSLTVDTWERTVSRYSQQVPTCRQNESIWSIKMCHFCSVLVSEIATVYVRTCKLSRSNFCIKKVTQSHTWCHCSYCNPHSKNVRVRFSPSTVWHKPQNCRCVSAGGVKHTGPVKTAVRRAVSRTVLVVSTPTPHPSGARNRYRAELTLTVPRSKHIPSLL